MKLNSTKKWFICIFTVCMSFFFTSCEELFTGNLFSTLDGPPSAAEILAGDDPLAGLVEASESPKFFDELENDDTEKQTVTDYLTDPATGYDPSDPAGNPADTPDEQAAALLHADIELETSEGRNAINNVADLFLNQSGDSFDVETVLDSLVPEAAKNDKETFVEMINALDGAGDAYISFGVGLGSADPPPDAPMGEVAQAAAVSIVIGEILENGDTADDLWNAMNSGDYTGLAANSGDPFDSLDGNELTAFDNIMAEAGMTDLF